MEKILINPEKIEEEIYLSIQNRLNPPNGKELESLIREEVVERNYLSESWQIDYAVERIEEKLENYAREQASDFSNLGLYNTQTTIFLILGIGAQILYSIINFLSNSIHANKEYSFSMFLGRISGEFIGTFFIVPIISLIISIPLYYICKRKNYIRKQKRFMRYIDYFAIVFFIITILFIIFIYFGQRQTNLMLNQL